MSPQELKKILVAAGLEVYQIVRDEVVIADRVRENLIMDSGVRLRAGSPIEVTLVLGVRRAHFPSEVENALFDRVRRLGAAALEKGFEERETRVTPVKDPSDAARLLDSYYEVAFVRTVDRAEQAIEAARFALEVAKSVEPR